MVIGYTTFSTAEDIASLLIAPDEETDIRVPTDVIWLY